MDDVISPLHEADTILNQLTRDPKMKWLVRLEDFSFDRMEAEHFVRNREKLLAKAREAGIPRSVFLPFDPTRPGFEERIKVLRKLPGAMGW